MATVQQIIDRAVDRANMNYDEQINTSALIARVSNLQRQVYQQAGILDPEYFGKTGTTAVRSAFTDAWDLDILPGDVGVVVRAYVAAITGTVSGVAVGDRIQLVNSRFPDVQVPPRAYVRGRKIVGHSTELGAASINMVTQVTLHYSERPPVVTAAATTLRLPDEFQDLLILPVAKYLALRDQRLEELPALDEELKAATGLFIAAVQAYGTGVTRPIAPAQASG